MALNVDLTALHLVVRQMGAELAVFDIGTVDAPLDPIDIGLEKGIELPGLEGVDTKHGLLSYEGRQILVYIQDQGSMIQDALLDGSKGRRFHVADCKTLKTMREKGRYDRYVVTNKLDGDFYVTGVEWPSGAQIEGEARLWVCQNCLKALNYKGAQSGSAYQISKAFSIEEFFESYSSFFAHLPRRRAGNVEEEGYTANWSRVAARFKAEKDFECESCGLNLRQRKDLLHVHHRNGVKSDNASSNLQALCAACHRKQPHHGHMFVAHEKMQLINRMRREQGLIGANTNWDMVLAYADPALEGLLRACRDADVRAPEVGLDLQDDRKVVVANLELAWTRSKLGVAIADEDKKSAEAAGWRVWTTIEALERIEQLKALTQR